MNDPTRRRIATVAAISTLGLVACTTLVRAPTLLERRSAFDADNRGWSFQHMAELFPTRTISRGEQLHALPRAERSLDDVAVTVSERSVPLGEHLVGNHAAGMVVLHEGRLVYERYDLGADETTRFTSWSVAKSLTATLVGLARADGRIGDLGDPIERYVPEANGTGYEGVTIRQALQMSSGVTFTEVYSDGGSDVLQFMVDSLMSNQERANAIAIDRPRGHEPGTYFNYNTAETQVLGWIVHNATGRTLSAYLEEKLWRPLGMEHDATWALDLEGAGGMEMAGCCLNMTLRDQARFGQLYLDDGIARGERILSEGWVAEATTPSAPHLEVGGGVGPDIGYQYQWWIFPDGTYAAEGVYGQFIWIDPTHRVVIARASAWPVEWDEALAAEAIAGFRAIAAAVATPAD